MSGHRLMSAGQLRGSERSMAMLAVEWWAVMTAALPPPRKTRLRFYRIPPPDDPRCPGYVDTDSRGLFLALQILDCQQCMAHNFQHEYTHLRDWRDSERSDEHHGDGFYLHLKDVEDAFRRDGRDR